MAHIAMIRNTVRRARMLALVVLGCAAMFTSAAALAQNGGQFNDNPALRPPAGARVAIVEFDDMQCPACAQANPILIQAAAKYKIPWLRHDFIIPYHTWSRNAALRARWFDTQKKGLGDQYRNEVFANQSNIYSRNMLAEFTSQFAKKHGIALPFALDPEGKLAAGIETDVNLGHQIGIHQTPTIFIVTNDPQKPYLWVRNPEQDLYRTIDQALTISHPVAKERASRGKSGKRR